MPARRQRLHWPNGQEQKGWGQYEKRLPLKHNAGWIGRLEDAIRVCFLSGRPTPRTYGSTCLARAGWFGPAIAPAILATGNGSYGVLYAFAGVCPIIGAFAILPVRRVR